ncbi:MAG: hypothetical protein A2138_22900 [Deltaproteobacteria bacterium RBG_16_71_12]|nr:MAG: hypothetical protein A2138_22900 [Deltaproteobacteria bacterium RBG_16_71_12]
MALSAALLVLLASAGVDAGPGSAHDAPPPPTFETPPPIETPDDAPDAGVAGGIPCVTVSANVEPEPVPFGARFELVVTVLRDRGVQLDVPAALAASDEAPQLAEPRRSVEELAPHAPVSGTPEGCAGGANPPPARVRELIRVPFLALALDDVATPAFVLTAKDGASVEVPSLPVRVADDPSLLAVADGGPEQPGQVSLEPAAGTIAYRVADQRPWIAAGALAGVALVALAARAALRRRRARRPAPAPPPPPPPRPAHEVALERLEALLVAGLLARGETAVFVERLMDEVLRDYLSARFSLVAEARTTRELVAELLSISMAGLDVVLVEELLGDADLVKFAKASIAAERAHAMAMRVKALVLATSPAAASSKAGAA